MLISFTCFLNLLQVFGNLFTDAEQNIQMEICIFFFFFTFMQHCRPANREDDEAAQCHCFSNLAANARRIQWKEIVGSIHVQLQVVVCCCILFGHTYSHCFSWYARSVPSPFSSDYYTTSASSWLPPTFQEFWLPSACGGH